MDSFTFTFLAMGAEPDWTVLAPDLVPTVKLLMPRFQPMILAALH